MRAGKIDAISFLSKQPDPRPGAIEPRAYRGEDEIAGIAHSCPCGCGLWSWLPLKTATPAECWQSSAPLTKSGDLTKITLTPSIGLKPKDEKGNYHWHGYLKAGVFEEC